MERINEILSKKHQWLIVLLVGILLMVIAIPSEKKKDRQEPIEKVSEKTTISSYTTKLETRLEKVLGQVVGVGKTKVMITLKSTAEKVIEKDNENTDQSIEEEDAQGGKRKTKDYNKKETTIYEGGNEEQKPYVKKEMTPEIEGIIVIAEGGGNPTIVKNITEAVLALFDVNTHKIKIMKMNQRK
ncbi:OapA N-terminal domain-containing protein [Faecalimonas sp.]